MTYYLYGLSLLMFAANLFVSAGISALVIALPALLAFGSNLYVGWLLQKAQLEAARQAARERAQEL